MVAANFLSIGDQGHLKLLCLFLEHLSDQVGLRQRILRIAKAGRSDINSDQESISLLFLYLFQALLELHLGAEPQIFDRNVDHLLWFGWNFHSNRLF